MRRPLALLVVVVALSGCVAGTGTTGAPSPDTDRPTATTSPTAAGSTVEYLVRTGSFPAEVASVNVTFRAAFVESRRDLGPCYPEAFTGPYQPTITPIRPPEGTCHRSETVTLTLGGNESSRSLGEFTAPASARGHALLSTRATVRYENGTVVEGVRGGEEADLLVVEERPDGRHGVELRIDAHDDRSYDYWLFGREYDPAG